MLYLVLALAVHVPAEVRGLAADEVARLQPGAEVSYYSGDRVTSAPEDVVVVLMDRCPPGVAALNPERIGKPLAVSSIARRTVFVFVLDASEALGLSPETSRFRIAVGRLIAHELEHVRRQSGQHDASGYFRACLTREDLTR